MSEENRSPLYQISLVYTDEDFERFLKFYRYSMKKVPLARMLYLVMAAVFGLAISYFLDEWIYLPVFLAIGAILIGMNYISDKKTNKTYMDQNRKAPSATYTFYDDRLRMKRGGYDNLEVMYHDFYTVFELSDVFYLMVSRDITVIIPKSECPEGMEEFIRSLDDVKTAWYESEEQRKRQEKQVKRKKMF